MVTTYRVCHVISDNPSPHMVFSQQYMSLRAQGLTNRHPRRQILKDISSLIALHHRDGFSPIIMMDANGDYHGNDKDLSSFITTSKLGDPFYERFHLSPPTNINGSTRIDYIFMDCTLFSAIDRISYLGTHKGAMSDHVFGYVDLNECLLFAGIINRPLPMHSQEILIKQEDKVLVFLQALIPIIDAHTLDTRIFQLARTFLINGATPKDIARYQALYGQFLEIVNGTVK